MIKYMWEQCESPTENTLHVDFRLSSTGENDRGFIRLLNTVPGVEKVFILECYSCVVRKGLLFDWADIRPAVLEVFRKRFGEMEEVDGVSVAAVAELEPRETKP